MDDAFDIIEGFHKKQEKQPRFCKKCKGEMKPTSRRTSTDVNYLIYTCSKCGAEEADLLGVSETAKDIIKNT